MDSQFFNKNKINNILNIKVINSEFYKILKNMENC